jgi:Signal peptidase, peptidase S26
MLVGERNAEGAVMLGRHPKQVDDSTWMSATSRLRRKRVIIPVATVVGVVALVAVLSWTSLVVLGRAAGSSSMSPTIPGCDGRWLTEGFTYRLRDPHRGEIVLFALGANSAARLYLTRRHATLISASE